MVDGKVSRLRAEAVRRAARKARLRRPSPARRASSADAHRGGTSRQEPRAPPPVLDGRSDAGGESGGVEADPAAYRDANERKRTRLNPSHKRASRMPASA